MKKILITGATGFVGANLLKALINKADSEIYIVARKTSDFWRINDLKQLIKEICYINLEDRGGVFELIKKIQPEIVYHIATYGGFPNQIDHNLIINSNLISTINLLDASIEYGVKQFINTGSSSEYGLKNAAMKELDICEPVNFYGISKLAATNYCTMQGRLNKIRVCTLRLFSPYGPLEDSSRLYASIVNSLVNNESPKLSRPNSVRDFIEIERVNQIYIEIVNSDYTSGDTINVGSGKQQTISEFYNNIAKKMEKEHIEPVWGEAPPRANEPKMWEADISKLKHLLPKI